MLKTYENETIEYKPIEQTRQKSGVYSFEPFSIDSHGTILPSAASPISLRKTGRAIASLIAGEQILTGETCMVGDGSNFDTLDTAQTNNGDIDTGTIGNQKVEQTFQLATSFSARYILIELKKTGSPTDNLIWNLRQAQDGGSIATGSIAGADLTTTLAV